jgi:hypothetical protein
MSDNPLDPLSKHYGVDHQTAWPHGKNPRRVDNGELPPPRREALPEYERPSPPPGFRVVTVNHRGEVKLVQQKPRHQHPFGGDMQKMTDYLRDGAGSADDD